MNMISWVRTGGVKSKIDEYLKKYDVVGLKKYLEINNISNDEKVEDYFYSKFLVSTNMFFANFNDEGKITVDYNEFYCNPGIMDFFCGVDSSIREKYSELDNKLFDYYHKLCSLDTKESTRFIHNISRCLNNLLNNHEIKLEEIFDGEKFKESFYDNVVKYYLFTSMGVEDLSDEFKKHFTEFELYLLKSLGKLELNISNYGGDIQEIISVIKREDINKFVKINKIGKDKGIDLVFSKETIPLILFQTKSKKGLLSLHHDNLDELREYLKEYLDPVELEYFLAFDDTLDNFFKFNKYEYSDLKKIMYLKDGKLLFRPEFISSYVQEVFKSDDDKEYSRVYFMLYFMSNYFDSTDKNKDIFEKNDIKIDNLIKLAGIYQNILNVPNSEYTLDFHINNIVNNKEFFTMESSNLNRYEETFLYLCQKVLQSNSPELKKFGGDILYYLLSNVVDFDYKSAIDDIESIFSRNNLPVVGKKYYIYNILHKDFANLDLSKDEIISPTLKSVNGEKRFEIIFSDLMRCSLGSNNISMRKYLENIYLGNQLYSKIIDKSLTIDKLPPREFEVLKEFLNHLCSLYNHTNEGINKPFNLTGNMEDDLNKLIPLFKPTSRYSLPDRIVRMFGYSAGFKSFEEAYEYMNNTVKDADARGRRLASNPFSLEKGDMVKGIKDVKYLYDILQNGSLCKEFLGPSMNSDATPLDTDLSLIMQDGKNISSTMKGILAEGFGPIYFVIKKGKFPMTRTEVKGDTKFTTTGPECFITKYEGHVGIRTGFATSDIDYIIVEHNIGSLDEIKFNIALNGIYIPIVDKKTEELLFTPKEYDLIRSKMDGLSYYDRVDYKLSNNLDVPVDYDNKELIADAEKKRVSINSVVEKVVKEKMGYGFKSFLSTDISVGNVQLIDTGSTGRGTNVGKSSDFDFIMRVDENTDREEMARILCEGFEIDYEYALDNDMIINGNNLRLKGVKINGVDDPLEIDISFVSKADQVVYTTDMAISDRLETIRMAHPDKYEDVLDNIIYAKSYLKEAGVYKPSHAKGSQGGLGGVGIENWILQNGGSFMDACQSFYNAATERGEMIPYEQFCKKYKIYDFGVNFFGGGHDEFVKDNMTGIGYKKMYEAVCAYIKKGKLINQEEGKIFGASRVNSVFSKIFGRKQIQLGIENQNDFHNNGRKK